MMFCSKIMMFCVFLMNILKMTHAQETSARICGGLLHRVSVQLDRTVHRGQKRSIFRTTSIPSSTRDAKTSASSGRPATLP